MKTEIHLLLVISCICACTKSPEQTAGESGGAAVIFDIGLSADDGTKAQTSAETAIYRLQTGLYNDAGELEWENTYDYAFTTVKTVTGLVEGDKTIVAVANKAITMPATLEEFFDMDVALDENRRDSFVMSGSEKARATVSPGLTTVRLVRAVTKISVRSAISAVWNDGKEHSFCPERIYLSNVATRTNLRGDAFDEFVNLREEPCQTEDAVIRDFTVSEKDYWVSGGVFNHGVDFYVCPNASEERKTTLIIQASYDGRTCYYPLVVADTLRCNTMYRCGAIVISCEGMPEPDDEFSSIRVRYGYSSEDWSTGKTDERVVFE